MRTESLVNSQSSMNSQSCARAAREGVESQLLSIEADQAQRGGENAPASFESEMNLIMSKMASTTARLKS